MPAQPKACLRKAEAMGTVVVAEFVDAGESARSANRTELKNMLSFVEQHRVGHVIAHKIDRPARDRDLDGRNDPRRTRQARRFHAAAAQPAGSTYR